MALVQMSNFLENELLDHAFNNLAYTPPASLWIALFTSSTALESNTQTNEVGGVGYVRVEVGGATGRSFTVAAARASENNEDWEFANPGAGGWGTVVAMAVVDASTGGQILMYSDLTVSRSIAANDYVVFTTGQVQFSFNETPDQISDHLAHELLDHVLRNNNYPPVGTGMYVALFTADNGLAQNTQTGEIGVGVGYARQTVAFAVASAGRVDNTALVTFGPAVVANWGTVTHMAVIDAATTGNVLMTKAIDSPVAVVVNDTVKFPIGNLALIFD
jgi:hypothetical protein